MNSPLELDAKPIIQRPYRLNLKYKEKVKENIDRILEVGIMN
jgi:hypothetical protein